MAAKRGDIKMIIGVAPTQKKYIDNLSKRDSVTRAQIVRLILADYIQKNPHGRVPRIIKETKDVEENIPRAETIQEIVDDMVTSDISQICNYPSCNEHDLKNFNRIIEYQVKDETLIELELVTVCVSHWNYYVNECGWKLELLE